MITRRTTAACSEYQMMCTWPRFFFPMSTAHNASMPAPALSQSFSLAFCPKLTNGDAERRRQKEAIVGVWLIQAGILLRLFFFFFCFRRCGRFGPQIYPWLHPLSFLEAQKAGAASFLMCRGHREYGG